MRGLSLKTRLVYSLSRTVSNVSNDPVGIFQRVLRGREAICQLSCETGGGRERLSQGYVYGHKTKSLINVLKNTCIPQYTYEIRVRNNTIINPQHACAVGVTVLSLSVR